MTKNNYNQTAFCITVNPVSTFILHIDAFVYDMKIVFID